MTPIALENFWANIFPLSVSSFCCRVRTALYAAMRCSHQSLARKGKCTALRLYNFLSFSCFRQPCSADLAEICLSLHSDSYGLPRLYLLSSRPSRFRCGSRSPPPLEIRGTGTASASDRSALVICVRARAKRRTQRRCWCNAMCLACASAWLQATV